MNNKSFLKSKQARYWAVGLVVVIVAVFAFLRFNSARASTGSAEATGTVTTVKVAQTVEASGPLAAQPSASLVWNTSGVVEAVNVKAGDRVKAGDVLMKLRTTTVPGDVISAQADLVTAQQDLENTQQSGTGLAQAVIDLKNAKEAYDKAVDYLAYLQRSQKVPQTETRVFLETKRNSWMYVYKTKTFRGPAPQDWLVQAQNDLALKKGQLDDAQRTYDRLNAGPSSQDVIAAQAKVDAAQAKVDSMSVIAPFDGEVLYIDSQPGDVVSTGTAAVSVADLEHLYVETQVDESDIASVKVGNQVTATLDALPGVTLKGQVTAINPVGAVVSGLVKYTVHVDLDKADNNLSLPLGATVNTSIQVKEATTMLAVPVRAIQNDSRGEFVWVVRNGAPVRVNVVGGEIVGDRVVVTGNLKEGEAVQLGQGNNGGSRNPVRLPFGGRGGG